MLKSVAYRVIVFGLMIVPIKANAQIIYTNSLSQQIVQVDLAACTTSVVVGGITGFNDMAVGGPTTYYTLFGSTVYSVNSLTGVSTSIAFIPGILTGLEYGPNGLLYAIGQNLYSINPATAAVVNIGAFPTGWLCVGDIVYLNGQYYAMMQSGVGPDFLIQVNMTNPSASIVLSSSIPGDFMVAGAGVYDPNCPKMYWINLVGSNGQIWEFDLNTQTWMQVCPGLAIVAGGAGTFPGYSFPYNCSACTTNAGTIQTPPINLCDGATLTVPYNNNATLDANDLLQYALFTDPANPAGSIVTLSNSVSIPYNALYVLGQTYYVATVAGNNTNGNVDLTDPCLDFSNIVSVVWRPRPAVTFTATVTEVCAGQCQTIAVNLTGTPPFNLSATATYANNTTSSIMQSFGTNNGVLTVCAPAVAPTGQVNIQATSLSDLYCICTN
jgi:hypothetical protein